MLKVIIADDHPLFRRGVKDILVEGLEKVTIGEAGSAQELLGLAKTGTWDVVIMDISMPGPGGPETVKDLKREYPALPILIVSMHPEEQYAVRMFRAGADGYLEKASAPTELVNAIKKVTAGRKYVSSAVAERLAVDADSRKPKPAFETLSDREHQVLCLIAAGKGASEIAEELALSVTTISTYRARVLEKLGLKNNAELTRYAIQNGLVN
jgi:DNA-binding NarL/FixJ family response regulator